MKATMLPDVWSSCNVADAKEEVLFMCCAAVTNVWQTSLMGVEGSKDLIFFIKNEKGVVNI
ncbi:hypothetical protein ACT9XH_11610 [Methanococcoides methylutens]|uniref:hypothetical protein n=1 Tax=Methanococcoides methylutens TaxID=2226 RepID=UPI00404415A0